MLIVFVFNASSHKVVAKLVHGGRTRGLSTLKTTAGRPRDGDSHKSDAAAAAVAAAAATPLWRSRRTDDSRSTDTRARHACLIRALLLVKRRRVAVAHRRHRRRCCVASAGKNREKRAQKGDGTRVAIEKERDGSAHACMRGRNCQR